jgi:hypothetical protein
MKTRKKTLCYFVKLYLFLSKIQRRKEKKRFFWFVFVFFVFVFFLFLGHTSEVEGSHTTTTHTLVACKKHVLWHVRERKEKKREAQYKNPNTEKKKNLLPPGCCRRFQLWRLIFTVIASLSSSPVKHRLGGAAVVVLHSPPQSGRVQCRTTTAKKQIEQHICKARAEQSRAQREKTKRRKEGSDGEDATRSEVYVCRRLPFNMMISSS